MSSLLVTFFEAAVRTVSALRASAAPAPMPLVQRRVTASSWGKL